MKPKINALGTLVSYHEDILELQMIPDKIESDDPLSVIGLLRNFWSKNLVHHFEFEQKVIFPAYILYKKDVPARKLIMTLEDAHAEITELFQLLFHRADSGMTAENIMADTKRLTAMISAHVKAEDDTIVREAQESESFRLVIGRIFLGKKNQLKMPPPKKTVQPPGPAQ